MVGRVLLIAGLALAACGEDTTPVAKDAGPDGQPDAAIDCSKVGCAAPPPCGEACTAPCGCCPNMTCGGDAGRDAGSD